MKKCNLIIGGMFLVVLAVMALCLSACKDKPTPPPHVDDGRKTTLDTPPPTLTLQEVITQTLGTIGLEGWVRYPVIPLDQSQEVGGHVTINEGDFVGADLIVCVDADCAPVIADQGGMIAVTFKPPEGGWSLGAHSWRIEYIGRTPPVELSSEFTAWDGDE